MKLRFLSVFAVLILSTLVFTGCFQGSDNRTSRRSMPSGAKNQSQKPVEELPQEKSAIEPVVAPDPVEVAEAELAAAESSLANFDAVNPRPKPKIGPVRAWFAREGNYNFYGRAIDFDGEVVTLQSYEDGRTVEVPIEKLMEEHSSHITEGFGDYLSAVNDWTRIRQSHEELVNARSIALEDARRIAREDARLAALAKESALQAERMAEAQRKERDQQKKGLEDQNDSREELIKKGFHYWDGSHIGLTRYIKERMKNPDSYEHESTKYIDKGNRLIIFTTFRGTNSFGAVVINEVEAEVDLKGKVLNATWDM